MGCERRDNCSICLEDNDRSQALMDQMLRLAWPWTLKRIARQLNPAHQQIFDSTPIDYYWSVHQSEWATDIMFKSAEALDRIYPALARGALASFSSPDVMRFLGRKLHGNFQGQVVSDYKQRPEGMRVNHRVKDNSVNVYNKQGSVLRPECTINDPHEFKVFRPSEPDPDGPLDWRPMRKGIADLHRRAQVSQACNERYLDALASINTEAPLRHLIEPVCRPVRWKGRRVRGLRPWTADDRSLLQVVNRGEFVVNGFRNRDIRRYLYCTHATSEEPKRRASAGATRMLRMLRAHGIIRKLPRTHLYRVTGKGRQILTAILQSQDVTLDQLNKAVA